MSDRKGLVTQEEVIYYELLKMEKRITEKADAVLAARDEIEQFVTRFELLVKNNELNERGGKK